MHVYATRRNFSIPNDGRAIVIQQFFACAAFAKRYQPQALHSGAHWSRSRNSAGVHLQLADSYGLIMAGQLAVLLFIAALKYYRQDGIFRRVGALAGAVCIGFSVFQAVLIRPLGANLQHSYSSHPIWHPIILGLGIIPNPLAEREGITWNDTAAWEIAKRVDPNTTYLGPKYDRALRSYYFQLWKRHPWEMAAIYYNGIFEVSRTFPHLGKLAQFMIWNGFVWFSLLLSIAIGGYFYCR